MSKPDLSIVVVGRNDNYGGDFTSRFQNCINWNTKWLEHYKLRTEIVFVNWNPVEENNSLANELDWPKNRSFVEYRILTVPNELHVKFDDPLVRDKVPLYEFIAKNVGIRRSEGKYVLCINADVLLHPETVKYLASGNLDTSKYYRADRWDYTEVNELSLEQLYSNGFALFAKGFQYKMPSFLDKRRWYEIVKKVNEIRLRWNLFKYRHRKIVSRLFISVVYNNGGYLAHCMASGDFILMTKQNWLDLKGYPEYTPISTHTDSILTILAYSKLKEHVFEVPVFHQAHERRYGWGEIAANDKFAKAYEFFENVANVVKNNEPIDDFLNKDDWGLEHEQIDEQRF